MAAETTKVVPLTCHGHSRPVTHLSFSSIVDDDQYYIISACKDNNPMLRDGITGDWIGTFLGHKGAVWQARLSSDATMAATGSADFSANIWDTQTGEILHTLQHSHIVRAVAFPDQPHPQILATGGAEKKLRIFDLSRSSGNPTTTASTGTSATTTDSNISSNTTNVTNNNNNENNSNSSASPPSYEIGPGAHTSTIKSILWTADPNLLVTAADDKKIRWWDLRARSAIEEYEVEGLIGSCELNRPGLSSSPSSSSPPPSSSSNPSSNINNTNNTENKNNDNNASNDTSTKSNSNSNSNPTSVLSIAAGKRVYFFDALKPAHLLKSIGMPAEVASVALHGGQRKFVTGSTGDTWVRVWDYDEEKVLETGKGHHGPIWSVSFSPDGKLYATGSEDGTVKLWKCTAGPYGLWR